MKVGFVHQPFEHISIPAREGALEIWVYEVARQLAKSCEVVVYSRRWGDQKKVEEHEGVLYCGVPAPLDDLTARAFINHPRIERLPGLGNPKRPLFASGLGNLEYGLRVAMGLRKHRCDVIHVMNYSDLVPAIRALNPRAKIVLHMQCEWLNQLDRDMIQNRLKKVHLTVACSNYIREKIRNAFPQFSERCSTVYNGADIDTFIPDGKSGRAGDETKRVVFVGRIAPEKGPHVLLHAFRKVLERHPQALLEMIGHKVLPPTEFHLRIDDDPQTANWGRFYQGNYLSNLKELLPPDIANRVLFVGKLSRSALAEHLRAATLMVCPSIWNEPFGMVITEAMSAGLPVVATRGGGIPEIVEHGRTGLLVERGNPSALADAIIRLLEDENLRRSMGQAGRQRVLQLFRWDKIGQDMLRQYSHLMSGAGGGGEERVSVSPVATRGAPSAS